MRTFKEDFFRFRDEEIEQRLADFSKQMQQVLVTAVEVSVAETKFASPCSSHLVGR